MTHSQVQAFVKLHRRLKFNQSGYALVQDDLLKFVHVPNDEDLRQRLEDGQVAEVRWQRSKLFPLS